MEHHTGSGSGISKAGPAGDVSDWEAASISPEIGAMSASHSPAPPADDDLQAKTEEELHKQQPPRRRHGCLASHKRRQPSMRHGGPATGGPGSDQAYFTGRYSATGSARTIDQQAMVVAEFGVPDGLRGWWTDHMLRHGSRVGAAALRRCAIKRIKSQVKSLGGAGSGEREAATPASVRGREAGSFALTHGTTWQVYRPAGDAEPCEA